MSNSHRRMVNCIVGKFFFDSEFFRNYDKKKKLSPNLEIIKYLSRVDPKVNSIFIFNFQ